MAKNVLMDIQENSSSERVGNITDTIYSLSSKGKCESDAEVQDRMDIFFQACRACSIRPGIESLCACLCVTRQTLLNWSRGVGCSKARTEMVLNAKQTILGVLEEMALSGLLNPATAIFMLKNWAGYSDSVKVEAPGTPFHFRSKEEILSSYNESVLDMFDKDLVEEVYGNSGDDNAAESEDIL